MPEIIVALDYESSEDALGLVDAVPALRWVKVGPMLLLRSGAALVQALKQRGLSVFLDLKWHDIPNSVAGAVAVAAAMGVDLATVHALGGPEMLQAAQRASGTMRLAAVTVLTSHTPDAYWATLGRASDPELGGEVTRLARLARAAGLQAVVSSPHEVGAVRAAVGPEPWLVVPGIRPTGSARDDQQRTADPRSAVRAGATHLVIGRPITRAESPAEVYDQIMEELR